MTLTRDGLTTAICDGPMWDFVNITCKSLGYKMGIRLRVVLSQLPPEVAALGGVYTLRPECNGTEANLKDCPGLKSPAPQRGEEILSCSWSDTNTGFYHAVLCSNEGMYTLFGSVLYRQVPLMQPLTMNANISSHMALIRQVWPCTLTESQLH